MALLSRYYTAPVSPYFLSFRRQFSVDRVRNIWISGLMDPANAKSKCVLFTDPIGKMHERKVRRLQRMNYQTFLMKQQYFNNYGCKFYDHWADYIADPAAITFSKSKDYKINMIHTPDCVDNLTVEVNNALRSFDCAVHTLSSVGEVQSQSISVDKKMRMYQLPRLVYLNKLNKKGANPWEVLNQARSKLRHHSAAIQVPIGLEDDFKGLVDLVQLKAYSFHGSKGGKAVVKEVPANMEALVLEKRHELIKTVSKVDDKLAEALCTNKPISTETLEEAVRRATIARKFIPVFMGTAFKSKGLQLLLDGVINYLPCPIEASNHPLDQFKNEEKDTLVAFAFTLNRKYNLRRTYLRIYKGVIQKGDFITNVNTGQTFRITLLTGVPNDKEIQEAHAGEIAAVDVYNKSANLLTDGVILRSAMTSKSSVDVPELVSIDS